MKKMIIIIVLFLLILVLNIYKAKEERETRAIFISYIELHEYISDNLSKSKANINKMINNISNSKWC